MAFPTIAATSSGTSSFGATSIATSFPSGTSADDLCILYVGRLNSLTTNAVSGWTKILTDTTRNGAHEVWWRRFQAGDTAPTVSSGTGTSWGSQHR